MHPSAVPPPEVSIFLWKGHQAMALTAALWLQNLWNHWFLLQEDDEEVIDTYHMWTRSSLPPLDNWLPNLSHFRPQTSSCVRLPILTSSGSDLSVKKGCWHDSHDGTLFWKRYEDITNFERGMKIFWNLKISSLEIRKPLFKWKRQLKNKYFTIPIFLQKLMFAEKYYINFCKAIKRDFNLSRMFWVKANRC